MAILFGNSKYLHSAVYFCDILGKMSEGHSLDSIEGNASRSTLFYIYIAYVNLE